MPARRRNKPGALDQIRSLWKPDGRNMGDDSDTDRLAGTVKEKEEVSENGRGRRRIRYGQCMERDTGRRESQRERGRKRGRKRRRKDLNNPKYDQPEFFG